MCYLATAHIREWHWKILSSTRKKGQDVIVMVCLIIARKNQTLFVEI